MNALACRVDALAIDVGRLRRHCKPETWFEYIADVIANHVETLDCTIHPTAHELYLAYRHEGWDEDVAVEMALAEIDQQARDIRSKLGGSR